jgi:hypothetical protein
MRYRSTSDLGWRCFGYDRRAGIRHNLHLCGTQRAACAWLLLYPRRATLLFLTWQLAPRRPHPWLPQVVRNRSLEERRLPALDLAPRPMARTAGAADSSSPFALTGPVAKPLSRVVALLAILLFLPIPFGNILPAFGLPCLHLAFLHGTNWPLSLASYPRSSV